MRTLDPGFDSEKLLTFSIDPSLNNYTQEQMLTFFDELRRDLSELPGVRSVSAAVLSTMADNRWMRTVRALDASLPIYDVKSMSSQVNESMFLDRLIAGLSAAFGLVACLLAAIGLYGVMSYTVTRRGTRREGKHP